MKCVVQKMFFITTLCCCFVILTVYSQGERASGQRRGGPPSAEDMVARMQDDLGLTDEQADRVKEVFEEERSQMEAQMNSGTRPDREQMESLRNQTEEKLAQILTSQQLEKWKNNRPQGGPGEGRGGPGRN